MTRENLDTSDDGFNPEQLKRIALACKAEKIQPVKETPVEVSEFTTGQVESIVKEIEGFVAEWVFEGELSYEHEFVMEPIPAGLVNAVAQAFKLKHKRLMVIVSAHNIKVTWDGMNHV